MAQSLLAHMYSHIRGSQEDIATYSIEHLVTKSNKLNRAFTSMLENALQISLDDNLQYSCQATGKQKERPDISGINTDGKEIVLCEAKFYAGLTDNQPNAYIDRLKSESGAGLVFICPVRRKELLWSSLKKLCEGRKIDEVSDFCISVDGIRLSIITWTEIFDNFRSVASLADPACLSDIDQFEDFCKLMDDSAFIPFKNEDFGPENARKEERHYQVLDAIVAHMVADKSLEASIKGLKATAYRQGYVRYIVVLGHSISINYDRPSWWNPDTEETPFWTVIYGKDFKQPAEYKQIFKRYPASYKSLTNNAIALPVFAPIGASLDEIAKNITDQIVKYIREVDSIA